MLSTRRGCWGGVLRCGSGATFRLCCCSSPMALSVTASCFSSACWGSREQELRSGCNGSHLPPFHLPRGMWPPSGEKSQSDWLWIDTGLQRGSYGVLRAPPGFSGHITDGILKCRKVMTSAGAALLLETLGLNWGPLFWSQLHAQEQDADSGAGWGHLTSSCSRSSVAEPEESPATRPYLVSRLELSFARVWVTESASSWN